MSSCPVCNAEIKEDFGLVTCLKCGSQVMVGIDEPQPSLRNEFSSLLVDELSSPAVNVESPPPLENLVVGSEPESPAEAQDFLSDEPKEVRVASPDMSELADFGNLAISQGAEGLYHYSILIGGIDTSEMRYEVKSVLADAKFLWDVEALMRSIRQGQLFIKDVSAVKASLLVQRLRHIPVEISWEQNAITSN